MLTHLKHNWLIIVIGIVVIFVLLIISKDDADHLDANMDTMAPVAENEDDTHNVDQETGDSIVVVDVKGEVHDPGVYEVSEADRIHDVIEMAGGFTDDADEIPVNLAQKVYDELIVYVPKKGDDVVSESGQDESGGVRINYATQEEIETLPGIGPSKAETILQYREENGHFQTVDDLLDISGIGEKTLDNMKDEIQIP